MHDLLIHPLTHGLVTGVLTAAAVDFVAFKSWQTWQEALTYNWRVASFRWFQGAVVGVLTAAGYGAVIG